MGETSFNEFNIAVFGLRVTVNSCGNNTRFGVVASVVVSSHGFIARGNGFGTILYVNCKVEEKGREVTNTCRVRIYQNTRHHIARNFTLTTTKNVQGLTDSMDKANSRNS